jgi:lactate dehydrogenase-like 2-hydroxyacid dehydrogenase
LRSVADGVRGVVVYAQSPHIGSTTRDTRRAMGNLTVDNLLTHFAGRPLLTPVP